MAGMRETRNAYIILRSSVNREITSRGIIGRLVLRMGSG
jgi:hypothetical protein